MEKVFLTLLNMSISASWLALAVILARLLLKKAPKAIICVMWVLVGIRLVLPINFESMFSLIPSAETVPQDIVYSASPKIHSGISYLNSVVNPIISEGLAPKSDIAPSPTPMQEITDIAALVWICGMILMLAYGAVSYIMIYRRVREAVKCGEVWLCDCIDSPFILGIIRPRILLPSAMDECAVEYVMAHERAHISRRDYIWKPLGFALLSVYWFNPVIWVAYVLLCRDIELACDQKVLREKGVEIKKAYSEALINCSVPRRMISACPLAFGEVSVGDRVKSVLSYKKPAFWIIVISVVACIVIAVCFLTNPKETDDGDNATHITPRPGETTVTHSAPLRFGERDSYMFYPKELVYDAPMFSFVMTADAAPDYRLINGLHFEELDGETIVAIGEMSEVTLTEDNFDSAFYSDENFNGRARGAFFRKDNSRAWEVRQKVGNLNMWYLLLEQKSGIYYICVGYFDHTDDGGDLVRWVYRVEKQRQTYIDHVSEYGGYRSYKFEESVDPMTPSLLLYDEPKTFTFSYSAFSSYFAVGKYELTDDTLTLRTDDGLYTYVFESVGEDFVFDASRSSAIPTYLYAASDTERKCPVPDGALFRYDGYMDKFSMIYDIAVFDIDSDGENENVIMSMGPTSGRLTIKFSVIKEDSTHYESIMDIGNWSDFYFEEDESGAMCLCTVDADTEEKTYHRMSFKAGSLYIDNLNS